jgi:hypothetical protein
MNMPNQSRYRVPIPPHLPKKLSIDCWIWNWIVAATPGEPYEDLERCILGMKARGFNAVRLETGLNWAFTLDGRPRGPVEFKPLITGCGWNFSSCNAKGGGRHDVLARVLHLFDLANKHDVWLIPTSWEYQDSTAWFVADPSIRAEIYAIPEERRFMHLAEQHDRLLRILKDRGLTHRIAYLEIHNEPEFSAFPKGAESRRLHQEAITLLRTRHPELLISGDFASHDYSLVPDNVQVFDQHVYAGSAWYFQELFGRTFRDPNFNPDRPRDLESLRAVLRDDDLLSWKDFLPRAGSVKEEWKGFFWLYENLDNAKWDRWVAESFARWKDRIWHEAKTRFAEDAHEAGRRRLPQVWDEGGFFFPPRLSRFELSPAGLSLLDLCADLAIAHGYWGFMPGTYCGPEHLLWDENPEWLRRTNERFQTGRTCEPAGADDV